VKSGNVSPYLVKGIGEGVGVLVGCGVCEAVCVACGEFSSDEHDKRAKAKGTVNRKILVWIESLLTKSLLADGIL
jgi:hypothetical protein